MKNLDLLEDLKNYRPKYSISREDIIKRFANKGSSQGDSVQFGPIYQLFMYAFMLGFQKGERVPLAVKATERKEFYPLKKWEPQGMVEFIFVILLSNEKVRKEAKIDFISMEDMDIIEVKERLVSLMSIFEEYANSGFGILKERQANDPYYFNDPFAFVKLLSEVVNS